MLQKYHKFLVIYNKNQCFQKKFIGEILKSEATQCITWLFCLLIKLDQLKHVPSLSFCLVFIWVFIKKKYFWERLIFSRGDLSWEGVGTLHKNSFKPFQDLLDATL